MKKALLNYLKEQQTLMEKQLEAGSFLKSITINQIAYILTDYLTNEDLTFIKECLIQDKYIGLYSNLNFSKEIKDSFRTIAVFEDDEKTVKDKQFFFRLNTIFWIMLGLALLALLISFGMHWNGFPLSQYNDTTRLFLPLLIIYGLMVGIDAIRSYLVQNQTINTYLQLNLFKPHRYDLNITWYYIDHTVLYVRLDKEIFSLQPGWYKIEQTASILQFATILESFTPLPKAIGLNENQVLVWLYEE